MMNPYGPWMDHTGNELIGNRNTSDTRRGQNNQARLTRNGRGIPPQAIHVDLSDENDVEIIEVRDASMLYQRDSNINQRRMHTNPKRTMIKRKRQRIDSTSNDVAIIENPSNDVAIVENPSNGQHDVGQLKQANIDKAKTFLKCPLCLDVMENITSTWCGHVFCKECITTAVCTIHRCPLCDHHLTLRDIHPLFL